MALASVANTTAAPREPPPNEILELLAHGRSPTRPAGTSADNAEAEAAGHSGPPALGRHGAGGHSATKAAKAVRLTASELLDALGRHAIAACPGLSTAEAVAKMWGEQRPTTRRFHATSLHSHASVLFALTPWSRFSGNAHSSLAAHCRQARCWEAQILHPCRSRQPAPPREPASRTAAGQRRRCAECPRAAKAAALGRGRRHRRLRPRQWRAARLRPARSSCGCAAASGEWIRLGRQRS
jgi:hypothetical protein